MFKRTFYTCVIILGLVTMFGCKSKNVTSFPFSNLYGNWTVVEINGEQLASSVTFPELYLDVARFELSGHTGCNRLMGKIEYSEKYKNIIRFLQVATTRKACIDMSTEQAFLVALKKVVRFEAESGSRISKRVVLFGANNEKLLVIQKK